jgi:hypothetical protein
MEAWAVEVAELSDERIDQSHQTKRPPYHSPPNSKRAKRVKITTSSRPNEFSKAEQIILRGAAEILDISLEQLLEVTGTSRSVSSSNTSFESDYASSSSSEAIGGAPPDTATAPFALKLPDISQRQRQNSRLDKPTLQHSSTAAREGRNWTSDGVIPWISGFSDFNQEPELWNDFLPFDAYGVDLTAHMGNTGIEIEQNDWPSLETTHASPVPHDSLDSLHVENRGHSDAPFANPAAFQPPGFELQCPSFNSPVTVSNQSKASGLQTPPTQGTSPGKPKERSVTVTEGPKSRTKRKRRGPFLDSEQRQETGLTRRLGACIRCSMQRIRVG